MSPTARFASLLPLTFLCLAWLSAPVVGFAHLAGLHHGPRHAHQAFPRTFDAKLPHEEDQERSKRELADALRALTGLVPGLAGAYTYSGGPVDVTGPHEWTPPGPDDRRGPCPGLNALANHHFISHDGVVGMLEVVTAINQVLGVGHDLAIANALLAVLSAGDPATLSFSIGGASDKVGAPLGGLLGLLGQPQGVALAHNVLEADCSLTRNDLFVTGDASTLDVDLFRRLYHSVPEGHGFDLHSIAGHAARRFHECVASNKYFYFGPVSGLLVANTAKIFAGRLMANHSDPHHPEGVLTHETLKSFFGIVDQPAPFTYSVGHERIPDNWYRRPGPYGLAELHADLARWIGWYPELASVGGNVGEVNSFAGVRPDDAATAGILHLPTLLHGNNLVCLALELVKTAAPSSTNNLFHTLFDLVATTTDALACPQTAALAAGAEPLNAHLQTLYPGAARANSGL